MHIDVSQVRTGEYFRRMLNHAARATAQRTLVMAGLFAAFGVLSLLLARGRNAGTLFGILELGIAIGVAIGAGLWYRARLRVPQSWSNPRRWILTDEWAESSSELTTVRWQWPAITKVALLPEAYALVQDGGTILDVPRAALSPEQDAELRAFLAGRGLLGPARPPAA